MNPYKGAAFQDAVTLFTGKLIVGLGEGKLRDVVAAELSPVMQEAHDRGKETQIREGLPHFLFNDTYQRHAQSYGWKVVSDGHGGFSIQREGNRLTHITAKNKMVRVANHQDIYLLPLTR